MKKKKIGLSFLVITLALLVAFSFVAISHFIIKTGNQNPSAHIDISASGNDSNNDTDNNTESTISVTVKPEVQEPRPEVEKPKPEVEFVGGKDGVFHKEIQVFYAQYGKDGELRVQSALGDKVVAPGTENQYDLYVRNVGEVPISYVLEAESYLTVHVNGEETKIPIEASFSARNNSYLLGGENNLEHLGELNGIKDSSGLLPEHQAKYTLRWSWPFDGDDEFDTFLGNLAAEGEELTVTVAFHVTATHDPNAAGGVPMTGDTSVIGLWVALLITSAFSLLILLFWRKREEDEENAQTHKEEKQ